MPSTIDLMFPGCKISQITTSNIKTEQEANADLQKDGRLAVVVENILSKQETKNSGHLYRSALQREWYIRLRNCSSILSSIKKPNLQIEYHTMTPATIGITIDSKIATIGSYSALYHEPT